MTFLLALLLSATPAQAQTALNRLYLGVSVVPGPEGIGVSGGWESRLGNYLWAGVAGFYSPMELDLSAGQPLDAGVDRFRVRHGVNSTLALRVPHEQPKAFQWDVVGRLGGGVVWVTDLGESGLPGEDQLYLTAPALAGVGGAEVQLRRGEWGLRVGARALALTAVDDAEAWKWFMVRPQGLVEGSWQW